MTEKTDTAPADPGRPAAGEDRNIAVRDLCAALLALESEEEANAFLRDLCTPGELQAIAERWRIARLLDAGGQSYREIASATRASTTTVARVARFLRDEPWQGYRLVLDRLDTGVLADGTASLSTASSTSEERP